MAPDVDGQGLTRAVEGEITPGDVFRGEDPDLQAFVPDLRLATHGARLVDHDHHLVADVGIDPPAVPDLDLEPHLFPGLPGRGPRHRLAAIHEAAGEHPLPP